MKIRIITGITLTVLGICVAVYFMYGLCDLSAIGKEGTDCAFNRLFGSLAVSFPLIIIGVLFLLSTTGIDIASIAGIILILSLIIQSIFRQAINPYIVIEAIGIAFVLFIVGIMYGLTEKTSKVKFVKNKK
jgi:hypothetical protein